MIIVLIKWKIKNNQQQIDDFLKFWRQEATIQDRKGLVGEFLSEIGSKEKYKYITWEFERPKGDTYTIFVNVGIWADPTAFFEQVGKYFDDEKPLQPFEAERRVRTVLEPKCWRIGDAPLPVHDSGGVL